MLTRASLREIPPVNAILQIRTEVCREVSESTYRRYGARWKSATKETVSLATIGEKASSYRRSANRHTGNISTNSNFPYIRPLDNIFWRNLLAMNPGNYLALCTRTLWLIVLLSCVPLAAQNFAIDTVYFGFDRYQLAPQSKETLDSLIVKFVNYPNYYVEIFGHTDSSGTDEYNLKLSELRAREVALYLIDQGVQVERITYEGLGTTKPAASNQTFSGREENRRADIGVLFTNNRAPLPTPPVDTVDVIAVPIVTIDPLTLIDTIYCDYAPFAIKSTQSYRLIAPKGSEVLIPANAFATEAEELTVEFKEMTLSSEYISAPMPLVTNEGPIESPGMVSISFTDGRRPADLVNGVTLQILIPATRRDQNITVYKGTGGARGGRRGAKDGDPAQDPTFIPVTRWTEQPGAVVRYNGREKKYEFDVTEASRFALARMLYYPMNSERTDAGFDLSVKIKGRRYPKTTNVMLVADNLKMLIPLKKESDKLYTAKKIKFVNDKAPVVLFAVQYDDDGNPWVVNFKFKVADYKKKGKGKRALPTVALKVKFNKVTEEKLQEILKEYDN